MIKRPNYEVVLRYLVSSADNEVELDDGFTYSMIGNELCLRLGIYHEGKFTGPPDEVHWAKSDISLNWFITECEKLEEEAIVGMCAHLALKALAPKR